MTMENKVKDAVAVIGEGITEYYYFNSLKDDFRELNLLPLYPKHASSLVDMEKEIDKAVDKGYTKIFCIIDMDNKKAGVEKQKYLQFKQRLMGTHNRKDAESYEIQFIETERCTEIFFLFYFIYTSREFLKQDSVLKELNKHCFYEKSEKFFRTHSLHQYFQKNNGELSKALKHAIRSIRDKAKTGREYTYSEMGDLFVELGII